VRRYRGLAWALRRDAADPDKGADRGAALEAAKAHPDAAVALDQALANAAAVALISQRDRDEEEQWDARRVGRQKDAGLAAVPLSHRLASWIDAIGRARHLDKQRGVVVGRSAHRGEPAEQRDGPLLESRQMGPKQTAAAQRAVPNPEWHGAEG
jgi:hypothetical protein